MVSEKSQAPCREYDANIINTVREPLIVLDQDLRVVSASRSFYTFFKVKPDETVGQLIYDLGNKQWDIPKLRELLETILPEKTTFDDYEVEHDFATIGRRTMLLNARKIKQAWGKEQIILLAIEDITDRKRLEELLEDSEMRYRRIFETASDGIVLFDKTDGHIVHANQAVEKMLGYIEADYIGKKLSDIGVPLDLNDIPAVMRDLDKSGILNYEDVSVKTKSGQELITDIYMVDRAQLAQCNIRDVTKRKLAVDALQNEKTFIENALNTLQDIFFVVDIQGKFIRWNRTLNVVTGYINQEIATMTPGDLFREEDKRRITETIQEAIREGVGRVDGLVVAKDGRQIPYAFGMSLLLDVHGKPMAISGVGRDITEHNKLEAQLQQAQKMEAIGTLTGGIAHDFNNILNVIMGYGQMVMDTLEAGSPAKEDMNTMLSAADKAAGLTKRLLLFSRKQLTEMKFVNINELIQDLQKMLLRMVNESIEFQLDLADLPLIVRADTGLIEQVLVNLCVNARDAMPRGGKLTICTAVEEVTDKYDAAYGDGKPGKYVLLTVADSGQGIDAEIQKKIFDPFFTTKEAGKGTGLGLAISYGIIKQHNGFIHVYSEPGRGTEFKIYLPLSEEAAAVTQITSVAVPVKGGQETVLVAEDEPSLRKLAMRILESFGYKIIVAEDGEEAITKFKENRESINLLMLDMIMPKKNGKEVADEISKISPGIKVLFASGYAMNAITAKEFAESGFDFIRKPYQSKNLLVKVREILDR